MLGTSAFLDIVHAAAFAANAHHGQVRSGDGGRPYITHPISVMTRIVRAADESGRSYLPPDVLIGALLHDVVEDTHVTLEEIGERFGRDVHNMIELLTDDPAWPREERKVYQAQRLLQMTRQQMPQIGHAIIKVADQLDNVVDLRESGLAPERCKRYLSGSMHVVSAANAGLLSLPPGGSLFEWAWPVMQRLFALFQAEHANTVRWLEGVSGSERSDV